MAGHQPPPPPLLSDRNVTWLGVRYIDSFFDSRLPKIVHEVRRELRGQEAADALHEGMVSKDGISCPSKALVVPTYEELLLGKLGGESGELAVGWGSCHFCKKVHQHNYNWHIGM